MRRSFTGRNRAWHIQYVDQNESGGNGRAGAVYLDVYKRRKQTSSAPDQYLRDRQRERRTARCIPCYRRKYRNRAFFTDGRRRYDSCDRTVGKWIPAGESIRKTGVSHRGGIGVPPILELAKQIGCEKSKSLSDTEMTRRF